MKLIMVIFTAILSLLAGAGFCAQIARANLGSMVFFGLLLAGSIMLLRNSVKEIKEE